MSDTVIFTFGRMNPPTRAHSKLIDKVVKITKDMKAHHVVFLSQSYGAPDNPLDWQTKRKVCQHAFPGVWFSDNVSVRNPFIALELLKDQYKKIILVAGSDRIENYKTNFIPFAKEWGIDLTIVSAGDRIESSRGVAGLSASKLRKYAVEGQKEKFFKGLPKAINSNVKELVYKNTRKGMKVTNKN